jgi:hypothetical protein
MPDGGDLLWFINPGEGRDASCPAQVRLPGPRQPPRYLRSLAANM